MVISVTGFTAARSQAIEDEAIVGGEVDASGDLILSKFNGGTINAGNVIGPTGPAGSGLIVCTSGTRPSSPTAGMQIFETDTKRVYIYGGTSWRWRWSSNGEEKIRKNVSVNADDDGITGATWPDNAEISVTIPPWAKEFEGFAIIGQAHQVTATSNTQVDLLLGSRVIQGKRIRWAVTADDAEKEIMLGGFCACDDLAGSTVLFRVTAERVSGSGALRLDSESNVYLSGRFTD